MMEMLPKSTVFKEQAFMFLYDRVKQSIRDGKSQVTLSMNNGILVRHQVKEFVDFCKFCECSLKSNLPVKDVEYTLEKVTVKF